MRRCAIRLLMLALLPLAAPAAASAQEYDVLIRGGRIVDGTGNPWYYADIAVAGDRIAAVGDLSGMTARRIVDARGLY
ncbi:MAG: D-aminoacylase, partial [Longimicrobiales bacterium]